MTRFWRAVSTTSMVIVVRSLMSRMRVIWAKSRCTRRKLPLVMRATAVMASLSVKSSAVQTHVAAGFGRRRARLSIRTTKIGSIQREPRSLRRFGANPTSPPDR